VDAFELGVLVVVAVLVLACCLAARASAGKRVSEFGRSRNRRLAPAEAARRDEQDLQEMLAVTNARRRARGLPERSVADAIREFGGD
jgi:Tfp pilus assembly protein PilX